MLLSPKKGFTWHEELFFSLKCNMLEDQGAKMSDFKALFFSLHLPKKYENEVLTSLQFQSLLNNVFMIPFCTYLEEWWGSECLAAVCRTKTALCSVLKISFTSSSLHLLVASCLDWSLPWGNIVCGLYQRSGSCSWTSLLVISTWQILLEEAFVVFTTFAAECVEC